MTTAKEAAVIALIKKVGIALRPDTQGAVDTVLDAFTRWLDENGWQIVPKAITREMLWSISRVEPKPYPDGDYYDWSDQWVAALTVAPKPEGL